MEIKLIPNTCSMAELTKVNTRYKNNKRIEKISLFDIAIAFRTFRELNRFDAEKLKTLIYNSNSELNWIERRNFFKKTGFKRVYQYKGNNGTVHVYMLDLTKNINN